MSSARMILVVLSIFAYILAQTTCNAQQFPNIDEDTGCPINVEHVCEFCATDQNRLGCYCELKNGDAYISTSVFTPCPDDIEDPCNRSTCQNGATCVREGLMSYKCNCAPGFGGGNCSEILPKCSDANIQCPNARCIDTNDPRSPVICECYDGTQRDPTRNETCPLSPCFEPDTETPVCQNNGTCRIINNLHICECRGGFAGQNCTKPLKRPLCEDLPGICGEGRCQQSLTPPFYSCNCGIHPGTVGKVHTELVKCEESGCYASNPCQNGGTCRNRGQGAFLCECPPRFTGAKCEKRSACYENRCLNKGECQAINDTAYFCVCPSYFTGQHCETVVPDPCKGKNCGLYGECRDVRGIGICLCNDGFHYDGAPCKDPCIGKNCGPGVCARKANASYEVICSCPVHRVGESCELPRDLCRDRARCGGGYCKTNYAATRGYSCVCEGGAIKNEPCPFPKNCPIKDCGAQGICVETDGIIVAPNTKPIYYVCSCVNGYISSDSCDELIKTNIPNLGPRCGPNGKTYPSRNPNNPVGCWCNNGTHIEEIAEDGPAQYCL